MWRSLKASPRFLSFLFVIFAVVGEKSFEVYIVSSVRIFGKADRADKSLVLDLSVIEGAVDAA
jgi:hypothetical protein